jgi:Ca2+-binding RTX toxin-like protein
MIKLGKTRAAGSFNFFSGAGDKTLTYACNMVYAKDLNGDGIDEVIFSGWETQPNLPATYSHTQITIYGWRNGVFQNLTNQYLPNKSNQVEGVGSISFGDFNGDGKLDMFMSAYADMEHALTPYVYLSYGSSFTRHALPKASWQHDSTSADINKDGFVDIVSVGYGGQAIYLGSANGLVKQQVNDFIGGSGVVVDDFLGDGSVSMIIIDHLAFQNKDFALYKFADILNGQVKLEYISTLPKARFDQPLYNLSVYGSTNEPNGKSHDIRAVSLDFNKDGLKDLIVISRPWWDGKTWSDYSEVQFLQNNGAGNFTDKTEVFLKNYDTNSVASYAPDVRDFNGDGLVDIFVSEGSYAGKHNSTAILFQQADGTFVDGARSTLSSLIKGHGGKAAMVKGPDNNYHAVSILPKKGGSTSVEITSLTFFNDFKGTNDNDTLKGSLIDDNIIGLLGDDFIEGLSGNDNLDGGLGIDTVGYTNAKSGVRVNLNNQSATAFEKNQQKEIGLDRLVNFENIFGSTYADYLIGNNKSNIIFGDAGGDTLNGLGGNDTLIGGAGADNFIISGRPSKNNFDTIQDFEPGVDKIGIEKSGFLGTIFRSFSSKTKFQPNFVLDGQELTDRKPTFLYNDDSGFLSYDRDGLGRGAAIDVAYIGAGLDLKATDFFII